MIFKEGEYILKYIMTNDVEKITKIIFIYDCY